MFPARLPTDPGSAALVAGSGSILQAEAFVSPAIAGAGVVPMRVGPIPAVLVVAAGGPPPPLAGSGAGVQAAQVGGGTGDDWYPGRLGANLLAWYRSDVGVTDGGNATPITAWADQSGNGFNAADNANGPPNVMFTAADASFGGAPSAGFDPPAPSGSSTDALTANLGADHAGPYSCLLAFHATEAGNLSPVVGTGPMPGGVPGNPAPGFHAGCSGPGLGPSLAIYGDDASVGFLLTDAGAGDLVAASGAMVAHGAASRLRLNGNGVSVDGNAGTTVLHAAIALFNTPDVATDQWPCSTKVPEIVLCLGDVVGTGDYLRAALYFHLHYGTPYTP